MEKSRAASSTDQTGEETDVQLVTMAQGGDLAAFDKLVFATALGFTAWSTQ